MILEKWQTILIIATRHKGSPKMAIIIKFNEDEKTVLLAMLRLDIALMFEMEVKDHGDKDFTEETQEGLDDIKNYIVDPEIEWDWDLANDLFNSIHTELDAPKFNDKLNKEHLESALKTLNKAFEKNVAS